MNKHLYLMIVTAIGSATFFAIGKFIAIPTPIQNFSLFLQYSVLIVLSFYFGPSVGFGVGFIGHLLIDLLSGYGIWMSWILSSGIFGLLVGFASKLINRTENPYKFTKILLFILIVIVSGAFCWVVIVPIGDLLFYKETFSVVIIEGLIAFITNVLSALLIGLPVIFALRRAKIKYCIIK